MRRFCSAPVRTIRSAGLWPKHLGIRISGEVIIFDDVTDRPTCLTLCLFRKLADRLTLRSAPSPAGMERISVQESECGMGGACPFVSCLCQVTIVHTYVSRHLEDLSPPCPSSTYYIEHFLRICVCSSLSSLTVFAHHLSPMAGSLCAEIIKPGSEGDKI